MSREEPAGTQVGVHRMRPLDQAVNLLAWPIEIPLEGAMQQFQQVYQENLGPIYRYVYRQVENREAAEDLTDVAGLSQDPAGPRSSV